MKKLKNIKFFIRQSLLEQANCLYRFKNHTLDEIGRPDSIPMLRGTEFHNMAHDYVAHLIRNSSTSDFNYGEAIATRYNMDASTIFLRWMRNNIDINYESIFALEQQINVDWDGNPVSNEGIISAGDAPFQGTLDRIELEGQTAHIWDYKTTFATFKANTIQTKFYVWLLSKILPGVKDFYFHLDFVRFGIVEEAHFTREQIPALEDAIEALMIRIDLAIENKHFPALTNPYCFNCLLGCPLVDAGLSRRQVGQISTPELAIKLAEELYALKVQGVRFKNILRDYVSENGGIDLGHCRLDFSVSQQPTFKLEEIVALNERYGYSTFSGLTVNPKEVKKIGKRNPIYLKEAERKAVMSGTSKFDFKKTKEESNNEDQEDLFEEL